LKFSKEFNKKFILNDQTNDQPKNVPLIKWSYIW